MNEAFINSNVPSSSQQHTNRQVGQEVARDWHVKLGNCRDNLKEPEICWWSCWCCWMVSSRTYHMFTLSDSFKESCLFWSLLILFLFVYIVNKPLGLLTGLGIFIYLAWRRAKFRTSIRQQLSIPGTFSSDFLTHFLCSCCAVSQEAQEAKTLPLQPIDFCFGETLVTREDAHNHVVDSEDTASCTTSITNHFNSLSKTSKFILFLSTIVALLTITADLYLNKSANILVILLVFIQPVLILYIFYWRTRRHVAYLGT